MYSLCDVMPDATITVLADDLDDAARENLSRTLRNHPDAALDIVDIGDLLAPLERLPIGGSRTYPRSIWSTLFLGSVLPGDLQRTLYLDSDVIVRHDPSGLWNVDLDGNVVAAVIDGDDAWSDNSLHDRIAYHHELGLAPGLAYFNSGVLLVDLDAWRRDDITLRCQQILRRFHDRVMWVDQEILNAALAGRWLKVDRRWNCMTWWLSADKRRPPYDGDLEHAVIRHFAGEDHKPWVNGHRPVPHRDEFIRLAERTGTTDGRFWVPAGAPPMAGV
jgi:lipopolysaccharide biosynthesis glycosyltransferase